MNTYSNIRRGFVAAIVSGSLLLVAESASAASEGTITVSGTIDPVNNITVTATTGYNALNLAASQTDLNVATVVEENNDMDGYTVTLASANAVAAGSGQARFKGALTGNGDVVNYSIKYNAVAVTLGATTGKATVTDTTAPSAQGGDSKALAISYTGNTWLKADTYSDTLTLTIAAK